MIIKNIKVVELRIVVKDKRGYIVLSHMGWEFNREEGYYIFKGGKDNRRGHTLGGHGILQKDHSWKSQGESPEEGKPAS